MIYLIDSHCHLHDREFFSEKQAEEMLERAHKKGVQKIICIGTSHQDSLAAHDFAVAHDDVYWTYGVHPSETDDLASASISEYISGVENQLILSKKIFSSTSLPVAIGEIGLDYHYESSNRASQIQLFERMLQLAAKDDLPVSFHVREAFEDFFGVIRNFPQVRGVIHSFTDSKKILKRILNETDFYVGINGLATYSTLPTPPLDRILLETDAPFLAPMPYRGKINEPSHIYEIAIWLADKLNSDFDTVKNVSTQNAEKLFSL